MNINGINESLHKQCTNFDETENKYREKAKLIGKKQLKSKIESTLMLSMGIYYLLTLGTTIIAKNFGIATIMNYIHPFNIPFLIGGCSITLGTITKTITSLLKKEKVKVPRLRRDTAKMEQEVLYRIKAEKAHIDKQIISKVIESLPQKPINTNQKTKEEINQDISRLNQQLPEKYRELELLISQKVLNENFKLVRIPGRNILNIILETIMTITCLISLIILPLLVVNYSPITITRIPTLTQIITCQLATITTISSYFVIRNNNEKRAFQKLNNKFNHILPNRTKNNNKDLAIINESIKLLVKEISGIKLQIQQLKLINTSELNRKVESKEKSEDRAKNKIPPMIQPERNITSNNVRVRKPNNK